MKSTLYLEFAKDVSISTSVSVSIAMGGAGGAFPFLRAAAQRTRRGEFEVVDPLPTDSQPAFSFMNAWNKDWKDIGGFNNAPASFETINGNPGVKITLNNENWTFNSVQVNGVTTGEILYDFDNSAGTTPKSYTHILVDGDCTDIDYTIAVSGGTAPYTVSGLPDGNKQVGDTGFFTLRRGTPSVVRVTDSTGALIQQKSIVPPKKLRSSDFDISVVPENGWNTANVSPNVVLESSVLPVTYSLDDDDYQSAGSFSDLDFEQTYTMYIKDGFGCTVQKTFVTLEDLGTDSVQQYYRNAFISNAGTLIFAEKQTLSATLKRNPRNSLSCGEMNALPYSYIHEFLESDTIVQQFKSSYGYHKVTLITDGEAKYIEPLLQSENLNQLEKVDGKLFKSLKGKMGLYFEGGNTYVPNTSTVSGTSYYGTDTLDKDNFPSWGNVGQRITIDGVGVKIVSRVTTDPLRGLYLEFADSYTSATDVDVKVQVNFNRQDYNTYEFKLPMSMVEGSGRVFIEMGFNDLVERVFVSEFIKEVKEDYRRSYIEWYDPLNKSGVVHQTGIKHFARMYVKMNHKTVTESELYNGDSDVYNLNQEAYVVSDFEAAVFGFHMENKLALASGMENFYINNVQYKKENMDSDIQGNSNIRVVKALLRMGGNDLTVNDDEIVLNPPSTPITAKPGAPEEEPELLAWNDSGLILNGEGGGIVVNV